MMTDSPWLKNTLSVLALIGGVSIVLGGIAGVSSTAIGGEDNIRTRRRDGVIREAVSLIEQGRNIFRFDTFGNESFWGGALRLHEAIAGEKHGGVGPGISPRAALSVGLKVDADALSKRMRRKLRKGKTNLDDPAVTLELLKRNAVVGITGRFDNTGKLVSMGIQCALCHSVVDDSVTPGIGSRLDGWANRDLNVGAIVALAPNLKVFTELLEVDSDTVVQVLNSWGPGQFDASLILDGKAFRPDGQPASTLIPPVFGLAGVNLQTWTGWGGTGHWNALVASVEMGGQGTFYDPRLNDPNQFPVAAKAGFGDIRHTPDLVTAKLPALHFYQLALTAPQAPRESFDGQAAARGEAIFGGQARCATCHVPPLFTEPGWNLHTPEEIGIDGFQANRSPTKGYRTAPLKGLWTHTKGGFYHDGRFKSLLEIVDHYDQVFDLGLMEQPKADLVEYLKSL